MYLCLGSSRLLGIEREVARAWFAAAGLLPRAGGRTRSPGPRSPSRSFHSAPPPPESSFPVSFRHPLVCLPSSWHRRTLPPLHPCLLPPPSPRVGWCGVLDLCSWLGPFPCRAGKFSGCPVHSFLHQHLQGGVERPHAKTSNYHFHSPLGAPTGSLCCILCLPSVDTDTFNGPVDGYMYMYAFNFNTPESVTSTCNM